MSKQTNAHHATDPAIAHSHILLSQYERLYYPRIPFLVFYVVVLQEISHSKFRMDFLSLTQ
jgi:hypothetical protein